MFLLRILPPHLFWNLDRACIMRLAQNRNEMGKFGTLSHEMLPDILNPGEI